MSVARPLARCARRPYLSTRYQCLQRQRQPFATEAAPAASPSPPKTAPPSFFRQYRAAILWSAAALSTGYGAGKLLVFTIFPPAMPRVGTHQDNVLMADLNKRMDEEFKVKVLRGKCLAVPKMLKGEEGGWVEIVPPVSAGPDRSEMLPFDDRLVDALQGAKGLGVERLFWDRGEKKLVAIVWFGGSLSGWPGVTHGGLLATAVTEKIALAAALARGGDANVNSSVKPQRLPGAGNHATMSSPAAVPEEPAQLSFDYVKPTYANNFYVIRVQPSWSTDEKVRLQITNHEYIASLETMDGKVCVKAAAKFDPRSHLEMVEEKVKETVGWSYGDFKNWMWPSRQKESQMA